VATSSDQAAAAVLLILGLVVEWLLIYSAVRAAVGHANDRRQPKLEAHSTTAPEDVILAVVNSGTGAAFDVAMGWADDPTGHPLAQTPLLEIGGRLESKLAAVAVAGETPRVRFLKVEWRESLDLPHRTARRAVLVPSRLSPGT
jgi:hypothetical protein